MVSKPRRRIVSLLQLTILNFKSKQRFYLFLCALLATILFLLKKLSATSDGFPLIRFDRERGRFGTGKVKFPPLHELVDRDRLWPSDLGEYPYFLLSDLVQASSRRYNQVMSGKRCPFSIRILIVYFIFVYFL